MADKQSTDDSARQSPATPVQEEEKELVEEQIRLDEAYEGSDTAPTLPSWLQQLKIPSPDLGPLRYAEPSDVNRLGIVQYAGFAKTTEYKYMYPDHAEYPTTAYDWERMKALQAIDDSRQSRPSRVCLVIEAEYKKDEDIHSGIKIPDIETAPESAINDGKVVVGFAVWSVPTDATFGRRMRCVSDNECPKIAEDLTKDEVNDRVLNLRSLGSDLEVKHREQNEILLDRLVVHPAYWRQGHGKSLVEWGIRLAKMDNRKIYVNAALDGVALYRHLGFDEIDSYRFDGVEGAPEGTSGCIMKYTP